MIESIGSRFDHFSISSRRERESVCVCAMLVINYHIEPSTSPHGVAWVGEQDTEDRIMIRTYTIVRTNFHWHTDNLETKPLFATANLSWTLTRRKAEKQPEPGRILCRSCSNGALRVDPIIGGANCHWWALYVGSAQFYQRSNKFVSSTPMRMHW